MRSVESKGVLPDFAAGDYVLVVRVSANLSNWLNGAATMQMVSARLGRSTTLFGLADCSWTGGTVKRINR